VWSRDGGEARGGVGGSEGGMPARILRSAESEQFQSSLPCEVMRPSSGPEPTSCLSERPPPTLSARPFPPPGSSMSKATPRSPPSSTVARCIKTREAIGTPLCWQIVLPRGQPQWRLSAARASTQACPPTPAEPLPPSEPKCCSPSCPPPIQPSRPS